MRYLVQRPFALGIVIHFKTKIMLKIEDIADVTTQICSVFCTFDLCSLIQTTTFIAMRTLRVTVYA